MNHQESIAETAVEKYLLDEMSPSQRDDFEEHYFGCPECAADVRATAAFLDTAKRELRTGLVIRPALSTRKAPWWHALGKPAFLSAACASLLTVIAVQNLVLFPRPGATPSALQGPEVLPTISLVGGNARGAAMPSLPLQGSQAFLVNVDVPTDEQYSSYRCTLVSPEGATLWRMPVSAKQAKDTVSIRVPASPRSGGSYTLIVQGVKRDSGSLADLANYRFMIANPN